MIEVYSISYTVAELKGVPENERSFFLAMTGLANDVQTLCRQLVLAMDFTSPNKIVEQGAHSVAMLNVRVLAGRIYEGWVNINDHYADLASIYDAELSEVSKQARKSLADYFSPTRAEGQPKPGASLLEMVRHKVGFHTDFKMISKSFGAFPDEAEMGEYICRTMGNTLYFSAELIHLQIITRLCGNPEDPEASLKRLMNEAMAATTWINDFAFGFVQAFLIRHFDDKLKAMPENRELIEGQPSLAELLIPYFVELPQRIKKGAESALIDSQTEPDRLT